jgi:PAS domain S-box-containing protein
MANPAILRMLGYESFEELAGRNLEKEGFEPAYSRSDFKERIETEGQVMGLESAWKRRDNTILYIRESAKAVRDKFGNTLYYEGTIEDITERKQAEEELRKIQESTQQFNEKLKVLHEITNELTKAGSTDEVCRLAVELGRKKLGFPRIGIWLKDSDPEYIRGTFGTDKNGNICDERDFSYKVRDMKKAPWKRVFFEHEEMSIEHDCQLQDAQGKAVGKGSRVSVRIWDGKDSIGIIFVDDLLEPGAITDRQVTIIESFASTIGHLYSQKRAEEEISLFAGTLAEKNKELESIMNIAAHDLRTPLVNIKGFGDLLQNNLQQLRSIVNESELSENLKNELETIFTEDIYENLKFIKMGTEMLDSLLKALLRLARLGRAAVGFQKLNMNEMISDITGSIKYHLDAKNVKLTIEPLPDCYGDKAMVGEVFLNLLSNAVKYLDPSRPAVITLSGSKKRDRIIYCVRDNGFGIDPEVQEHVFDIFYRIRHGEQHVDGEGMGLTIVRRIMDFHEGKVRLESEKGIGSKFYVSFPAAKEPLSKRILEIKKGIVPAGTIPRQESYR